MSKTATTIELLKQIEQWSGVYELSFQFWGKDNMNVYIHKGGVEIASFGGEDSIHDIFLRTMEWINKKNPKGFVKQEKAHRCAGCGTPIAIGNDYCSECLCEDDCDY